MASQSVPPSFFSKTMPKKPSPRLYHRGRAGKMLLATVAVLSLAGGGIWSLALGRHEARADLLTYTVHYEQLQPIVHVSGELEPAVSTDIICRVQAFSRENSTPTTIRWIIEDGTPVQRGQLLAQLDDSGLLEDLAIRRGPLEDARAAWLLAEEDHKIVRSQSQADIQIADNDALLAEINLQKYVRGDYRQLRYDVEGRIALAESALQAWTERVAYSERMYRKGFMSQWQLRSERSQLQCARISLSNLREELGVLRDYSYERTVVELKANLGQARRNKERVRLQAHAKESQVESDRLSKMRIYRKRLLRCQEVEAEINKCRITAPHDGLVVYFQPPSIPGGRQTVIGQGEPARLGQRLMRLPDLNTLMVVTHIPERVVQKVRGEVWAPTGFGATLQAALLPSPDPMTGLLGQVAYPQLASQFEKQERSLVYRGQKAILRLHAFPDRELHGHVKQVAELPAQYDRLMADVRAYKTQIAIDEPLDGLRPGMTAEATILTEEAREHVLTVPISAVVGTGHPGATDRCFVLTPEGPQERDIVVGTTDEKVIEIRSGLHEGDEVVLNPRTIKDEPEESPATGRSAVGVAP